MPIRNRATLIVETKKGILLTSALPFPFVFSLPGGGIRRREIPAEAAKRELEEETSLKVKEIKFLFTYKTFLNNYIVFSAKAKGTPIPQKEVRKIAFLEGKNRNHIRMFRATRNIIQIYRKDYTGKKYSNITSAPFQLHPSFLQAL